ncbi:synaptic vesicle glycoprotein 2C-like isoform X1 [Scomber japonicus]|uniref:synaptic vesicle glycoprotein 2C-like isoform X1 n=1 Tax=Scomber japonicus TaxID=13676 RepID=UPI0023060438|nr:synaptic vesicle glycoprotein 2C-like isoform X1 [Scomber japonicus]
MDETHNNRTSLAKGAKDIAKEAKRQAAKNFNKAVDRATDEYSSHRSYNRFQNEDEEENNYNSYTQQDGRYADNNAANDDDGASSDATEGHDDEDEIYEGEYQGVPAYNDGKLQDGKVALGQPVSDSLKSRKELENERQADEEELAQQYELIMQECGHGRFQWQLFFVLGLALMSDGVEVFVVGFVLPSAETDMCVPNSGAGWLGSIVYLGMMFGAFFWGGLSDKVGRKQCLLISMSVNGFFAFLSSFVQGYSMFLLCRMVSGFGIGGAVPIVFSWFAEVLAREKRGEHLSWLCMFWMIGGIYASAMAWAIIPHYGDITLNTESELYLSYQDYSSWSFSMGSAYQFHSWRVFVVVCALPCVSAVVALTFMPESPRFFLEMGKHDEAWMVLKHIHDTNMRARGEPERVFTVNRIKIPKQLDELVEMQNESANPVLKVLFKIKAELRGIWLTFMRCFNYPVKDNTVKLAAVWFTLSFGYYGLSVWFPDVIKHLQADEYASRVKIHNNERIEDFTFNFTLENQIHRNGVFLNDKFISMRFKSVTFIDSSFLNCYFEDVSSVGSFFKNCTFADSFFYNTDIDDAKLTNSMVINSSFHHNKTGCQMTFDDDYSAYWVYFVNFLGTLAVLPGNIVSALLMDKIGRLSMLGGSMVLSGISCFFLWFGTSESMMIFMLCLYNGLSISAWNSLDVVTAELYPTDRRGTGFGFCNAMCKLAAVLGNLIFGSLVGITKAIPILLASAVLVGGGLVGLRLPDTRANVLM